MLEDGDVIEIGGKQGTVCFTAEYNNEKYICIGFVGNDLKYEVYSYKYEGEKLLVAKIEDPTELTEVMKIFINKGLDEVGLPEKFEGIFDEENN